MRTLVVLAILAVAVLVVGGQYAESRAADLVAEAVADRAVSVGQVDVELVGTPVLYHLAVGRLPEVRIEVDALESGRPPVVLDSVVTRLHEVRFDPRDLVDGRPVALDVASGTVTATLSGSELARIVARDRPDWQVRVESAAIVASGTVADATVGVVAEPRLVESGLELRARRVETGALGPGAEARIARAFEVTVGLPRLPGDVRLTDVAVEGDHLRLAGEVRGEVTL